MGYKEEMKAYNKRVNLLKGVKVLDEGPGKGNPAKVHGVYVLSYKDSWRDYDLECLACGPFDASFGKRLAISGQNGDYTIYLLDKELDPNHRVIILQRGRTARILLDYEVVITFSYNCDPLPVQKLAASLATLVLKDSTTLDKIMMDFLHPKEDKTESDF